MAAGASPSAAPRPAPATFVSVVLVRLRALLKRLVFWMLSAGPLPGHVAIIMDGNRRFADRAKLDRKSGHIHGYDRLLEILEMCHELGVKVLSVYAFSIDNFKREEEEVNALMSLLQSKLEELAEKHSLAEQLGLQVRLVGDLSMLPPSVQRSAEHVVAMTKQNRGAVLNVCAPYTSREEMVHAITQVRDSAIDQALATRLASQEKTCSALESSAGRREGARSSTSSRSSFNYDPVTEAEESNSRWRMSGSAEGSCSHDSSSEEYLSRESSSGARLLQEDIDGLSEYIVPLLGNFSRPVTSKEHQQTTSEEMASDSSARHSRSSCHPTSSKLLLESISSASIEKHLYTSNCPSVDLLIRTSGETRLSNFLLWQSSHAYLYFCQVLWPEFSFWNLVWAILEFQVAWPHVARQRKAFERLNQGH